jgi:hypothetical protein
MKKMKFAAMAAILTMLASCGVSEAYLMADRDTFEAVSPDYVRYVQDDEALTEKDRKIFLRTIKIWEERLEAAEAGAK